MSIQKSNINYEEHIEKLLNELLSSEENTPTANEFRKLTKHFKPKSCETKYGWKQGVAISLTCKFEKGGENDIIKEIVKGINNKSEVFHFLYGLSPDYIHFNPKFIFEDDAYFHLSFKLARHERIEDM